MLFKNTQVKLILRTLSNVKNYGKPARQFNKYPPRYRNLQRKRPEDVIGLALESISVTKPQDWKKVTQFVMQHELNRNLYNSENIEGMIMGCCVGKLQRTDLAKSYLKYLKEESRKPNLATLGKYLKLLYQNNIENMSKGDEKEIINLCKDIEQNNPVLDALTQENMIIALSLTEEWKKCLNILEEIKITSVPSTLTYNTLIAAAFRNKEEQLAWDLLREMLEHEKPPLSMTFQSYLTTLKNLEKPETISQKLETLFVFMNDNDVKCREDVAKSILQICKNSSNVTIKFSGKCENCNRNLKKFDLSETEFSELKEVFFKNVIVGKDIFIKSDPAEMKRFQDFVNKMGKFDVVLDGLNIAYSAGVKKGSHVYSKMVAAVVSHFVQQNKSVLMLGRDHMQRWPKTNWDYITENSTIFLTQNISQDDPYLLYCALHSGKNTAIVTRDLMRSHKFLLKERKYKILFDRWLMQRQSFLLYVNDSNRAAFRNPPHFIASAQKNKGNWHIPYIPEGDNSINEKFHKTWICLDLGN